MMSEVRFYTGFVYKHCIPPTHCGSNFLKLTIHPSLAVTKKKIQSVQFHFFFYYTSLFYFIIFYMTINDNIIV